MPENDQPEHWTLLARAINKAAKDWPTTFRTSFVIAVTGTAICFAIHFAQPSAEPQPPACGNVCVQPPAWRDARPLLDTMPWRRPAADVALRRPSRVVRPQRLA